MKPELLKYKAQITSVLEGYLRKKEKEYKGINKWSSDLIPRLIDFSSGGKCVRGSMFLFSYSAKGKKINRDALLFAAGLELIHAALLIHDDIMDHDSMRRGKSSIHMQYSRLSLGVTDRIGFGQGMGICAGDIAYFLGLEALSSSLRKMKTFNVEKVWQILGSELSKVAFAQMQDLFLPHSPEEVTIDTVINLYRFKTARYTFSLPFMLGAVLSGEKDVKSYERLGEDLGIVFQIKDDELDMKSTRKAFGKPIGSDIKEGKQTLYRVLLMQKATLSEKRKLKTIFGNPKVGVKEIRFINEMIEKKGVDTEVEDLVSVYSKRASKIISKMGISRPKKKYLLDMLDFNLNRDK